MPGLPQVLRAAKFSGYMSMGSRKKVRPVLVLGIGNILMRDEGVGVHVVNRIMEKANDIPRTSRSWTAVPRGLISYR